jgi:hypothetical protein
MLQWKDLGNEFERRAADLAAQMNDQQRQEQYSAWARESVHRSIDELSAIVKRQIEHFPSVVRSELCVEVAQPTATKRVQRVLWVSFGNDSVHLHAQWSVGAPPTIHVLLSRKRGGREARLITLPGGWLRRTSTAIGFQVCTFDGSGHEVPLEEIAYRGLRLLAAGV